MITATKVPGSQVLQPSQEAASPEQAHSTSGAPCPKAGLGGRRTSRARSRHGT